MNMIAKLIAQNLGINLEAVINTLTLLEEGCTIPFISRYRKERTGGLDEVQIAAMVEKRAGGRLVIDYERMRFPSHTPSFSSSTSGAVTIRYLSVTVTAGGFVTGVASGGMTVDHVSFTGSSSISAALFTIGSYALTLSYVSIASVTTSVALLSGTGTMTTSKS